MYKVMIIPFDGIPTGLGVLESLKASLTPNLEKFVAYIKINDAIHNMDKGGPQLVADITRHLKEAYPQEDRPKIFLDLKIYDVDATVINTLKKYQSAEIGILTVSSQVSLATLYKLRQLLPTTKLAMVSVPTDISSEECRFRYGQLPEIKIYSDLQNIRASLKTDAPEPFDLIVCSGNELEFLKRNLPGSYGFIVPGIRDHWMPIDHQKRTMGTCEAINKGATFLVSGAQLLKGNPERGISPIDSCYLTEQELKKSKLFSGQSKEALQVLTDCNGYYKSKMDKDGNPYGPLVAYAGTYQDNGQTKNYVGLEYFNFAKAEEDPEARAFFAKLLAQKIKNSGLQFNGILGAPMGGIMLATEISAILKVRGGFIEKKVTDLSNETKGQKEKSRLVIDRHDLKAGDKIILVEDVCNNFSTTEKVRQLIEDQNAELVLIVCAFNRSPTESFEGIPIISAQHIPTKQYTQEADIIKELIEENKIVWSPKLQWKGLLETMK